MKRLLFIILCLAYVLIFLPSQAGAQNQAPALCENLVPCGGKMNAPGGGLIDEPPCNLCHIFQTVSNILNCVLRLTFLIGAVLIVFGGILILLSVFYPNLRQTGKTIVINVIYGLIIMMLSYIIIISILATFANVGQFNFNLTNFGFQMTCQAIP